MATFEIKVPDGMFPEGLAPVEYRPPVAGELIDIEGRVTTATEDNVKPRLILSAKAKTHEKKVRPYNAEEMRNLYIGRARLQWNTRFLDVIGYDSEGEDVLLADNCWYDAEDLQNGFTHLDGNRCEVVE